MTEYDEICLRLHTTQLNCQFEWIRYHWLITLTKSTNHWKIRDFVCAELRELWFLVDILFPFSFQFTSMKLNKIYDNISTFFSHQKWRKQKIVSIIRVNWMPLNMRSIENIINSEKQELMTFFSLWIQLTIVQMKRKITFLYSHWKKNMHACDVLDGFRTMHSQYRSIIMQEITQMIHIRSDRAEGSIDWLFWKFIFSSRQANKAVFSSAVFFTLSNWPL